MLINTFTMTREQIKDLVGNKRWSVTCERLESLILQSEKPLIHVQLYMTSDHHFLDRKVSNKYDPRNIVCLSACIKYGDNVHSQDVYAFIL
jgi:hypothetical protein